MEIGELENIKGDMAEREIDGLINGTDHCHSNVDSTLEELWGQPENPIEQIARDNRLLVS